ncbi:hypothetical protein GCM10023084_42900 [Streptomyces lacrimifluminis]|uniref:Integral membrane protein n=1 Tax=Streptomyces lacrimifluminis TaxID=1500077 RepID=A0A917KFT9_9ACTN|nr:hypothetical protein [Streptomyces lacrimifluminis]GGJ12028.1 hypothetical protein GCM10012282_05490 [Streptomyces lacrimifluminis]
MYGPGAPPPTRSAGTVITLRVLITAAGFLSCGLLACLPLFRVAFLRGRWFNWTAAWASLPLSILCFAVVGTVDEGNADGDIALAAVMLLGAVASTYFLVMDIRPNNRQHPYAGYVPDRGATVPPGYGYPSPYANPRTGPQQPPVPHTPISTPQTPTPRPPVAQGSVPPPPQRPAPARIDQVRAELDELSDYLRKHDSNGSGNDSGNRDAGPEGGR